MGGVDQVGSHTSLPKLAQSSKKVSDDIDHIIVSGIVRLAALLEHAKVSGDTVVRAESPCIEILTEEYV